jgi:uncharacterized membrane protein
MPWLFVALTAPALSALGSYTDKYLLVHHERTGGLGSVIIFSCLFGAFVMPIALYFGADIGAASLSDAVILMANGFITVGTLAAYLYAIREADVLTIVPVLQTIPVFGFFLGYVMLGETLTTLEIIGSGIIILSAVLLSLEIEEDAGVRFKAKGFFLAVLSSAFFAFSGVVFKLIATDIGYWSAQFWEYVGISLLGILLFAGINTYRNAFLDVVRNGRVGVAVLNFATEAITVSADLLLNFATLLAPIALVYTANAFQPAFLLLYAMIGMALVPNLMRRLSYLRKHVLFKVCAIGTMIAGAIVINF